jgi:hypothetical protein
MKDGKQIGEDRIGINERMDKKHQESKAGRNKEEETKEEITQLRRSIW